MNPLPSLQDRRPLPRGRGVVRMAALAVAVIALTAGTSVAQDGGRRDGRMRGGGMMQQLFQPELIRRDLALIDRELDLDDGQTTVVETLLFDYDTAFTGAVEAMRDRFAELRPERPEGWQEQREQRQQAFGEMRDLRREMREARERAENGQVDAEAMQKLQDRMEEMREKMRELRPPMPEGEEMERIQSSMSTLSKQWRDERTAIRREFMNNLQAVMNEEQIGKWPAFERALTREKKLRNGRLSGEQPDLFIMLRDAGYPDKDLWLIHDALDAYAASLDAALTARDAFLEESQMEAFSAMMAGETDRAAKLMEREAALRTAVRDVNEQYAQIIAARVGEEMPGPVADEFRTAFQRRAYPMVYRATASQRAFRAAQEIEGLDPETIVSVMTLEESYLTELADTNRRLVELTRQYEPERNARRLERRTTWMRGRRDGDFDREAVTEREPDPIQEGFERRRELDDRYRKMLETHLTPEQIAQLPEPDRRDREGWDGSWDGRGDGADRRRRDRDGEGMDPRERRERRERRSRGGNANDA